jgi:hypothetical protein
MTARKDKKTLDLKPLPCKGFSVLTLVEHPTFTKNVLKVFEDDEYRELQTELYLHLPKAAIIYLFYLFTKGDITDLTPEQKKQVAKLVTEIKEAYEK